METSFVLGGGCFWCLDSVFNQFRGIVAVDCGYTGGSLPAPTYEQICEGDTGHAEVVRVRFDAEVFPVADLLDLFFTLHDPTQLNRQGNDLGTQYRSSMFYSDASQRELFTDAITRAQALWELPIVTSLEPLTEFYLAEDYHQDFFAKNPCQGYCVATINPKLAKTRAKFANFLR